MKLREHPESRSLPVRQQSPPLCLSPCLSLSLPVSLPASSRASPLPRRRRRFRRVHQRGNNVVHQLRVGQNARDPQQQAAVLVRLRAPLRRFRTAAPLRQPSPRACAARAGARRRRVTGVSLRCGRCCGISVRSFLGNICVLAAVSSLVCARARAPVCYRCQLELLAALQESEGWRRKLSYRCARARAHTHPCRTFAVH